MVRVIAWHTASAPWPASAGPFFTRGFLTVTYHSRQVQQHREPRRALDKCSNGGAAKTENEITFPMSRHCTVGDFYWALADHDLG